MPQMIRLNQGHWLNLETITEVRDDGSTIAVWTTDGDREPLRYIGEERDRLLAWLAYNSAYVAVSRPDNDNPFEESTDEPAD